MMAFTVGQKVVCVDDAPKYPYQQSDYAGLEKGRVYVVRQLAADHRGVPCLRLEGLVRRGFLDMPDYPLAASRFRPIVERKTEISFTIGADPESDKWDNRRPAKVYEFDTAAHEEILSYLRGFY